MAYDLPLSKRLRNLKWKVKIREREFAEPPHITIFRQKQVWRMGLRDKAFLIPPGGRPWDLDKELRTTLDEMWGELQKQWDAKYPENPVSHEAQG